MAPCPDHWAQPLASCFLHNWGVTFFRTDTLGPGQGGGQPGAYDVPLLKANQHLPSEDKPRDGTVPVKPLCGMRLQIPGDHCGLQSDVRRTPPALPGTLLCIKTESSLTGKTSVLFFDHCLGPESPRVCTSWKSHFSKTKSVRFPSS